MPYPKDTNFETKQFDPLKKSQIKIRTTFITNSDKLPNYSINELLGNTYKSRAFNCNLKLDPLSWEAS